MKRRTFFRLVASTGLLSVSGVGLGGCAQSIAVGEATGSAGPLSVATGSARLFVDALGRSFALDARAGSVRVDGGETTADLAFDGVASPIALDVASDGRVAVVDAATAAVRTYGSNLAPAFTFASADLRAPSDVAYGRDGSLFVSDASGHRVIRLGRDGSVLGSFGQHGAGARDFDGPRSLAFAPDGSLHVLDAGNARVQVLDASLALRGSYGVTRHGRSLCVDGAGRTWVADRVAGLAEVYADGSLQQTYTPVSGAPQHVCTRPDGSVYVTVA